MRVCISTEESIPQEMKLGAEFLSGGEFSSLISYASAVVAWANEFCVKSCEAVPSYLSPPHA
eukprot:scaffold545287_cov16-Prasinocladus_malaysianus.AAC.1